MVNIFQLIIGFSVVVVVVLNQQLEFPKLQSDRGFIVSCGISEVRVSENSAP